MIASNYDRLIGSNEARGDPTRRGRCVIRFTVGHAGKVGCSLMVLYMKYLDFT